MTGAALAADEPRGDVRRVGRPPAFLPLDLEPVLPAQWFTDTRGALRPAKRLMLAVLTDAIDLVLQDPAPPTSRRAFLQRRAADWIYSDERGWLFAFLTVCETLGMDPVRIRTGVHRLVDRR
jgi:hypothetical protein